MVVVPAAVKLVNPSKIALVLMFAFASLTTNPLAALVVLAMAVNTPVPVVVADMVVPVDA